MIITIPGMRLINGANSREHHMARARRAKDQRNATRWVLQAAGKAPASGPLTITITRHGAGTMDTDGLAISAKHVRDGIADWLGMDDGHQSLTWVYRQEKCKRGQYAVTVEVN